MELRLVNPRTLKFNPDNPRRTKASPEQDAQLAANIKAIGVIQPPLVKPKGKALVIVAGERRVKAAVAAEKAEIHVLVSTEDDGADAVRSLAENVQRAQLGPVDQWRGIEALCGAGWSEEAIAAAVNRRRNRPPWRHEFTRPRSCLLRRLGLRRHALEQA